MHSGRGGEKTGICSIARYRCECPRQSSFDLDRITALSIASASACSCRKFHQIRITLVCHLALDLWVKGVQDQFVRRMEEAVVGIVANVFV